jgi:pimeloyl-ACP methyl ester carboxylesterase
MSDPIAIASGTRYAGDGERVAVMFPGGDYSPARPLLHFARSMLVQRGWTVQEIWWQLPADLADSDLRGSDPPVEEWVCDRVTAAVDAEGEACKLIVGKSLGSLAAEVAAERTIPAVWLTPLLYNDRVLHALERSRARTLLVGGSADTLWDSAAARRLPHEVLEFQDADHWVELSGDALGSLELLRRVIGSIEDFINRL